MRKCDLLALLILFCFGSACVTIAAITEPLKAKIDEPQLPVLPRKALSAHLLATNADWVQYYDMTPQETVRLYYNLAVILDIVRQQNARIQQLMARIEVLEKQNPAVKAVPGQAAPDVNAPPTPAVKSGGTTEKKPVE